VLPVTELTAFCGLTLELSGRCRDKFLVYTKPIRSGPLERIVSALTARTCFADEWSNDL